MPLSSKCHYAVRALLELAQRDHLGRPVRINEIAEAQSIPLRFLEVILNELRQGGFTESRRGKEGGYLLARAPREISVGAVIRFVEGPLSPADPTRAGTPDALTGVWDRAERALAGVYDEVNFEDLAERERLRKLGASDDYAI